MSATTQREANEQFRQARLRTGEMDPQDKKEQDQIRTMLLAAEEELDDVTRQIQDFLRPDAERGPDASPGGPRPGP